MSKNADSNPGKARRSKLRLSVYAPKSSNSPIGVSESQLVESLPKDLEAKRQRSARK